MMADDVAAVLLRARPEQSVWRWGTVTTRSPLAITLDSESAPLAGVPLSLWAHLAVGDRVFCLLSGTRLVVVGSPTMAARQPLGGGAAQPFLDSSGYATITHGLGRAPNAVMCSPYGATSGPNFGMLALTDSYTSTTFRVRVFGNQNSVSIVAYVNTSVFIAWTAY